MSLTVYLQLTCASCGAVSQEPRTVYQANITHNLNKMASEAGCYEALWHPERLADSGPILAGWLVGRLSSSLALLELDPPRFKRHDPPNGWGSYDGLCAFVRGYLAACREFPDATVETFG